MDQKYDAQYLTEVKVKTFSKYFALLAIFLSCFGLFGLAIFNAETRVKEIGIRKVLGASIPNIFTLLSFDFIKLVLVAYIIGMPIAYYFSNRWLQNFAYHIHVDGWTLALSGILAIGIAFLPSFQSIKAAIANPVNTLRREQ